MKDEKVIKEYQGILHALSGGTVPREGLSQIAVGREYELNALLNDADIVAKGGGACRLVVGDYGSGKTFLIQTIKEYTVNRGFVAAEVDLSTDRCLIGSGNKKKGLATYRELMTNVSNKSKKTGYALQAILDEWIQKMFSEAALVYQSHSGAFPNFEKYVEYYTEKSLKSISEMNYGCEFVSALNLYWKGSREASHSPGNIDKRNAIRWLKGEIESSVEAKKCIKMGAVVTDDNWFEFIKLWSAFFVIAGYKGFYILIDELAYISNSLSSTMRQKNYEKMLSIYNDITQGKAHSICVIFSATPKAVFDKAKGIYSYEAMKSRLTTGSYSKGYANGAAPIVKIQPLSKEENYILLEKLAEIHSAIHGYEQKVSEDELLSFIRYAYMKRETIAITPRSMIRDFLQILDIGNENAEKSMSEILLAYKFASDDQADYDYGD